MTVDSVIRSAPPASGTCHGPRSGRRAVVIGAGFGGLATAARLAHAGYQVTVLERHAVPGGRAGLWESEGFRFDTGPSLLTLPEVFADWREAVELGPRWKQVLDRYKVDQVLLRPDRALVSALREVGWRVVTEDARAVLLERPR